MVEVLLGESASVPELCSYGCHLSMNLIASFSGCDLRFLRNTGCNKFHCCFLDSVCVGSRLCCSPCVWRTCVHVRSLGSPSIDIGIRLVVYWQIVSWMLYHRICHLSLLGNLCPVICPVTCPEHCCTALGHSSNVHSVLLYRLFCIDLVVCVVHSESIVLAAYCQTRSIMIGQSSTAGNILLHLSACFGLVVRVDHRESMILFHHSNTVGNMLPCLLHHECYIGLAACVGHKESMVWSSWRWILMNPLLAAVLSLPLTQ